MTKRALGNAAFILAIAFPGTAAAQGWAKDRSASEGAGIKVGDLEIHPAIAGELGYDSNWFLRSSSTRADVSNGAGGKNPVIGTGLVRITPSLALSTMGNIRRNDSGELPAVQFRMGLGATYRAFLNNNPEFDKQKLPLSGQADARLELFSGRPWGFNIAGSYVRTVNPTFTADPNNSFNRNDASVGAEVVAIPGGGTLDWHLGYRYIVSILDDEKALNMQTHEIAMRGRWKFRPLTAFLYDGNARFAEYMNTPPASLHDSTPVRARLGLSGLITPRFSLLALAGWGASFFKEKGSGTPVNQFDSVIGQAEARFFLTANPGFDQATDVSLSVSSISAGFQRDFQNSYLGDYFTLNRFYGRFSYMFAGRLLVNVDGGFSLVQYPNIYWDLPIGTETLRNASFNDKRPDVTVFGEYRFSNTFAINTTLRYAANISDTFLRNEIPSETNKTVGVLAPGYYDMSWNRFEGFIGVRWFM